MNPGQTVRAFHEQTKHRPGALRRRPHGVPWFMPMDPANRPAPFKRYHGATPEALPTELPTQGPPAVEVLCGRAHATSAAVDVELLARLLFFSGGVTRVLGRGRYRLYFRAAASAGNLHPLETYLVCDDLPGLAAGVYHFAPDVFALERLRNGDYRTFLGAAAAHPDLATAPAALVVTGIPWRTAWKYGERGWRHLYWDAGTMLANLLAIAEATGIGVHLLFGFHDADICRLLGIDGTTEFPLVVLGLSSAVTATTPKPAPSVTDVDPLRAQTNPLSPNPIEFPLITAAQRAGVLNSAKEIHAWRAAATALELPVASKHASSLTDAASPAEPIDAVILRRGSTRAMLLQEVPAELLMGAMSCAIRPVPADALPTDRTLLVHLVSLHAVAGIPAGQYEFRNGEFRLRRRLPPQQARAIAAHLCLDQELGGDSAYTTFISTHLNVILDGLGDRGYRVAQTEAGIVAGRLQLAAFALRYGATGLTFYDDAISSSFESPTECMLACAVGVPAYRSRPGGPPLRPVEFGVPGR
jgi:SagB-type dehydrogenase family enzyme